MTDLLHQLTHSVRIVEDNKRLAQENEKLKAENDKLKRAIGMQRLVNDLRSDFDASSDEVSMFHRRQAE
jgi:regulator of replication initiation timing